MFYSRKAYLAHQYKKMMYHPYSYRITIDEHPIPLQQICVLSYLCLLLTKVLFETSFKSCQYNTAGRRLSNYSIKLILCSHYRSRCKGLCQNKKHAFYQYTKGGHFCAAHMALIQNMEHIRISGTEISVIISQSFKYPIEKCRFGFYISRENNKLIRCDLLYCQRY